MQRRAAAEHPADSGGLTVIDEAGKMHSVSKRQLVEMPHQILRAKAHGVEAEFSGVSLVEVLKSVGVESAKSCAADEPAMWS